MLMLISRLVGYSDLQLLHLCSSTVLPRHNMEDSNHVTSYSTSNPDPAAAVARGRRTLINTLYRRAEIEPNKTFGSYPVADKIEDGFRDFTFAELASAIDVCAWHLRDIFGMSDNFEPILYMGANDFRYTLIFFAAIKCGYM